MLKRLRLRSILIGGTWGAKTSHDPAPHVGQMVWGTWVSAKRQGGGLCSLLSSAARLGSFDGGSVGLAFMDLHTWGLPSRRPPLGTRCGAEWAYPTSTGEEGFFSARVALSGAPPPVPSKENKTKFISIVLKKILF